MAKKGYRTLTVKEDFYDEVKSYYMERSHKEKMKELVKKKGFTKMNGQNLPILPDDKD